MILSLLQMQDAPVRPDPAGRRGGDVARLVGDGGGQRGRKPGHRHRLPEEAGHSQQQRGRPKRHHHSFNFLQIKPDLLVYVNKNSVLFNSTMDLENT